MDKRSIHGRTSDAPAATSSPRGGPASVPSSLKTTPAPSTYVVMETPEVASEEVVLNRRGMPARQRKRNKIYFDEDNIVTGDNIRNSLTKTPLKKLKQEPVDTYDDSGELDSFPPFVQNEVQIQYSPRGSNSSFCKLPVMSANTIMEKVNKIPQREHPMLGKSNVAEKSLNKKIDMTSGKPGVAVKMGSPRSTSVSNKKLIKRETPQPKHVAEKIVSHGEKTPQMKYSGAATPSSRKSTKSSAKYVTPTGNSTGKGKHDSSSGNRHNKPESTRRGRPPKYPAAQLGNAISLIEESAVKCKVPPLRIKKELLESPHSSSQAEKETLIADTEVRQYNKMVEYDRERSEKNEDRMVREREKKKDRDCVPTISTSGTSRRSSTPVASYVQPHSAPHQSPSENQETHTMDKIIAHEVSIRLRNLLKLPKAHKWVCYEWFYSNIDKVLFEGENDFQQCLKESFPRLKARKLTRVDWCKIRRMMGKPRRCSLAFFNEEREDLARRRQKIRMIRQRKITDFNYKELPDEIPLQLVIGTKVTGRLRRPLDGLFTGTIEGVDTSNNNYRITFDRGGLGTHSIPDYEVHSNEAPETVLTSSFAVKIPRQNRTFIGGGFKLQNASLLGADGIFGCLPKSQFSIYGMVGGFPIQLLDMIVRLSKLLKVKREKILQLKELNVEAEKLRSYTKPFNEDYRLKYARCVLDLDSINKQMAIYLDGIQKYCLKIAPDHKGNQMIVPEDVQSQCTQEANLIVGTYNTNQNRYLVHNPNSLALISKLTSLMLQVKALSIGDKNLYELQSIKDTIKEIKKSLSGQNVQQFQDRIEIPMNRIQAGLCVSRPNKNY